MRREERKLLNIKVDDDDIKRNVMCTRMGKGGPRGRQCQMKNEMNPIGVNSSRV